MHTFNCISVSPFSSSRCLLPFNPATGYCKSQHIESFLGGREGSRGRRGIIMLPMVASGGLMALSASGKVKSMSPYDERRLLEQNKKIQEANNAPVDFPNFVREGFEVKVVTSENYVKRDSGLIYLDIEVGKGDCPKDGQQVGPSTFFSAKLYEVFDVELFNVQDCQRRTIVFYSDVVCS